MANLLESMFCEPVIEFHLELFLSVVIVTVDLQPIFLPDQLSVLILFPGAISNDELEKQK